MSYRSIEELQLVLRADGLEPRVGCCIQLSACTAVGHVDVIDIVHKAESLFLSYVFKQRSAKIIGDVVLSVRESACTAEPAHDRAALASDAAFHFDTIDRAFSFAQFMAGLKNSDPEAAVIPGQLVSGVYPARACTYYYHIIIHIFSPFLILDSFPIIIRVRWQMHGEKRIITMIWRDSVN